MTDTNEIDLDQIDEITIEIARKESFLNLLVRSHENCKISDNFYYTNGRYADAEQRIKETKKVIETLKQKLADLK